MTARAVPARFDGSQQHRRAMLGKVHIAKKVLRLTDDDYRAVLIRVVGRTSAADCSQLELDQLVKEFERLGFDAKARPRGPRPADHPVALKARAMWISLHLLGAVKDPSEKALESFARRQLGTAKLQWANQALGHRLIEALKAMAEREGWNQATGDLPRNAVAINLKRRLCETLLIKLREVDLAPADWSVDRAAFEFAGVEIKLLFAGMETLDVVAQAFGRLLSEARA